MRKEYIDFFKENKYVVVRNFLEQDKCLLLYEYVKSQAVRQSLKYTYNPDICHQDWDGTFLDSQTPGVYSQYGDPLFDSLLNLSNDNIISCTGLNLTPQYSYYRLYETESELKTHIDRDSCEISVTMCLGYNIDNLENKSYNWTMYVNDKSINLNIGDILIYRGCEVKHGRDKFKGLNQAQVFLHYNDVDGPYNNKYDGREYLGIPKNI
tara:strand:+ start:4361 stop:4987 length:627 start_codon:yes stop_codon:yes gene_type:complete